MFIIAGRIVKKKIGQRTKESARLQ